MAFNTTNEYLRLVKEIRDTYNVTNNITRALVGYHKFIYRSELQNHYSSPMFWIGMYIALASLVCIVAMVADLLHGFRSKKLWFPCKYFRVNSAFLTIISVAMKLPVDLTGSMMGTVDKVAKLGSMAFICTMMANLLPCLASMDNNDLLSNITALSLLVITLVVNVCIQIKTGVISTYIDYVSSDVYISYPERYTSVEINAVASTYAIFLVVLLMVHVCSSVAIPKSKKIIESKYQQVHDRASKKIQPSPGEIPTIEKLHKHVRIHWIMARSGSPQFITACFPTTSAIGVICLLVTILHTFTMVLAFKAITSQEYDSDYGSSMILVVIVQFVGVVIGTITPLSRCFATLSFKVSSKTIRNHFQVFKVERRWTQKLYDWKHTSIRLPFPSRNLEVAIETLKRLFFSICIGLQNGVVVVCKVIALILFLFMICFLYSFRCIKWLLKKVFPLLENKFEKLEGNNDLRPYVLQLEDEIELGERTLKGLSEIVNRLIQKGEKSQPNNLMKLIHGKSTSSFEGVKKFDHIDDHDFPFVDCWRLQVVTLTTIAVSLPEIQTEEVDSLLECVGEGLEYVTVVERSLNAKKDHVSFQKVVKTLCKNIIFEIRLGNELQGPVQANTAEEIVERFRVKAKSAVCSEDFQKAAETLWQEIIFDKKWLGNELQDPAFQANTAEQIVERFRVKAERFRVKAKSAVCSEDRYNDTGGRNGGQIDDLLRKFISANSMYRITKTIMLTCHTNIHATVGQKELFDTLSSIIADLIAACLTNLPQAITMKCHTSVIEEREDSVKDAAQLLSKTREIIVTLQDHDIPDMNPSDLPFIEKWRAHLGNP